MDNSQPENHFLSFLSVASNSYWEAESVTNRNLAPVPSVKIKKRPRGRSFEKGHGFGAEHRFKPGQSGNPKGRPKCKEISKALRELLASDRPFRPKTGAEKLALTWFKQSLKGNVPALVSLSDRCEGRPNISIGFGSANGDNVPTLIAAMTARSRQIGPPEDFISLPEAEEADGD
jgi:hypothetical protein